MPISLWSPLRTLTIEDVGFPRLRGAYGASFDTAAFRRVAAYLAQAESYYLAAEGMAPVSRPLVAYYFFLNVTKAFLTCTDPSFTAEAVAHGLSDAFERRQRYWFQHERTKVAESRGRRLVFEELAKHTGSGYCHPPGTLLSIERLAPYLVETADLVEDCVARPPKIVPTESVEVFSGGGQTWLRTEVERGELRRRGLGPASLSDRCAHFGSVFRHVRSDTSTASYESIDAWPFGGKQILLRFPATEAGA